VTDKNVVIHEGQSGQGEGYSQPGDAPAAAQGGGREWRERAASESFPEPLLELIAARFRLLGEPIRLKLLALIAVKECSVGELAHIMATSQPNVSKHLAALAQGGLVQRRKVGTTTLYTIADPSAFTLCDAVCAGLQQRLAEQLRSLGLEESH
jgi:DNA-binding transcriptional ArsR family regulator